MATYTLLCRIATSGTRSSTFLHATRGWLTSHSTTINTKALQTPPFQARSLASPANSASIFDVRNQKKYYILGGKGSVGKTSCAASLAVKFANYGHPTLLISTDNTHSISDVFDQDLTGRGAQIRGLKSPLYAREINLEELEVKFRRSAGVKIAKQFGESKFKKLFFDKLFASTNPVMDEAVETSLGYVLPLLSFPEIRDATMALGNIMEIGIAGERMKGAGELIRDSTEFVIMTNPTVMAVNESSRLHASLKGNIPVRRLIVNEILPPSSTDCRFCSMKRKDEMRALDMIKNHPELSSLDLIEAPFADLEMRGIPALKIMGDMVRK